MQITISLPPDIEQHLIYQAAQSKVPLQTIILQALRQRMPTTTSSKSQWPDVILCHEGIREFPNFESYREELLPPRESELF